MDPAPPTLAAEPGRRALSARWTALAAGHHRAAGGGAIDRSANCSRSTARCSSRR